MSKRAQCRQWLAIAATFLWSCVAQALSCVDGMGPAIRFVCISLRPRVIDKRKNPVLKFSAKNSVFYVVTLPMGEALETNRKEINKFVRFEVLLPSYLCKKKLK